MVLIRTGKKKDGSVFCFGDVGGSVGNDQQTNKLGLATFYLQFNFLMSAEVLAKIIPICFQKPKIILFIILSSGCFL